MHRLARRALLAFVLWPLLAVAHGPAPAALGALSDGSGGFAAVHTNIGLATPRTEGGYRYICPIQWGAEDLFPSIAYDDAGRIILAVPGVVYRGDGCVFRGDPMPGWQGRLGGHSHGVVLERLTDASRFWDVRGDPFVLVSVPGDVPVDSLMRAGNTVLFGSSRGPMALWMLDLETLSLESVLLDGPLGDYVSIRSVVPLMFVLSIGGERGLYELDGGAVVQHLDGKQSLHGPVAYGDGWVAVADGDLWVHDGVGLTRTRQVDWACILDVGSELYACRDRGLWKVSPQEGWSADEPAFGLGELTGLDDRCMPDDGPMKLVCQRQWIHFGAEAGLIMGADAADRSDGDAGLEDRAGSATAGRGSGCTASPGSPSHAHVVLAVLMICLVSSRRQLWHK